MYRGTKCMDARLLTFRLCVCEHICAHTHNGRTHTYTHIYARHILPLNYTAQLKSGLCHYKAADRFRWRDASFLATGFPTERMMGLQLDCHLSNEQYNLMNRSQNTKTKQTSKNKKAQSRVWWYTLVTSAVSNIGSARPAWPT